MKKKGKRIREKTIAVSVRCRRPSCKRDAVCRGLCRSCYQAAFTLVTSGVTTWEHLERRGKVDEPRASAKGWFLAS